ncbi:MAG: 16S rRNA (cytidine(1402)-2'-O)-methyltransferase [Gammaproteobacteria bacterium]
MSIKTGTLYVVATPIGNRKDITQRALEVLAAVDKVAAEDTRHSRKLLSSYSISASLVSLHEHNERSVTKRIVQALKEGASIALISDAGTPLISDPGYRLVRDAHEAGIPVVPVPGPSALICALSGSGLATDRFVFEGFLAARRPARRTVLTALAKESRTMIFYESCHRIVAMMQDLVDCFGAAREAVVARELTKMFETIRKGSLAELQEYLQEDSDRQKGEFVVLVAGAGETNLEQVSENAQNILTVLVQELPVKQATALTAKITGEKRNALYEMALALSDTKK